VAGLVAEQQRLTDRHTFQCEFPAPLDPVVADEDKLVHIFGNLLSNAVKYSPAGGIIGIRVVEQAQQYTCSVSDEGLGLTSEQAARVFERYERAVDPNWQIPGTGLGLPLVRAMVQAQGGEIHVESQPGRGSTFSFTLPKTISGLLR